MRSATSARSTTRTKDSGRSARASRSQMRRPLLVRALNLAAVGAFDRIAIRHQVKEQHAEAVDVRRDRAGRRQTAPARDTAACRPDRGRAGRASSPSRPDPKSISTMRPASSRITLCAFTSRCSRPACVDGGERTGTGRGRRATASSALKRTARVQLVFERAALDELHPQADVAIALIGAVD